MNRVQLGNPAPVGKPAPALAVAEWFQGQPVNFDALRGQVVLLEVFQVNCPGCFLYSLPQAIALHHRYADQGLTVLGVATAFEDFDKNTTANLRRLLETGELIGETLKTLTAQGLANNGCWTERLPFAVGMDELRKSQQPVTAEHVEQFILEKIPHFDQQPVGYQNLIRQQVLEYLKYLEYQAVTFQRFALQGTPSHILVDQFGILRSRQFGYFEDLEMQIRSLLAETQPR